MAEGHYFISYSSYDKGVADEICDRLESEGLQCWIAPRDVEPGAYGASIVRAIRSARALVFLASAHSAVSVHVGREIERAVDARVAIVPLRLDGTEFADELEYYLAGMHWLDWTAGTPGELAPVLIERLGAMEAAPESRVRRAEAAADAVAAAPRTRRRGVSGRVLDALLAIPPPIVAFALAILGSILTGLSMLIGIGEFAYPLEVGGKTVAKEVGFLWAFNWSLSLILIYPAIAGVGLQALREMSAIGERLSARHMVIEADFRPAKRGFVEHEIRGALCGGVGAALCVGVVAVGYSVWEFQLVVGQHFFTGNPFRESISIDDPYFERDWSVAALLPSATGTKVDEWPNYIFAFVVYVLLAGFSTAMVLGVFISFLAVATFAYRLSARREGLKLVPDLRDPPGRRKFDRRCGFEVFEALFHKALLVVLLSFGTLFLIHLQNIYLRAPEAHILDFALPDLTAPGGIVAEFLGGGSLRQALSNLNSALAYAIGSALFASIVFGLSLTLRLGAKQARGLMLEQIEDEEKPMPVWLESIDRETALERLDAMSFWPVRWPRLNHIVIAIVLAGISLIFHRIGLIVISLALVYVLVGGVDGDKRRR